MTAKNDKTTKKTLSKASAKTDETEVAEVLNSSAVLDDSVKESENIKTDFETVSEKPPEMVRIRLARKHDCNIGGTPYHFEKGKVYDVPADVKRVLSKGDLLRPLS